MTESDIEKFVRDGYLVAPGLVDRDLVEKGLKVFQTETGLNAYDEATWTKVPGGNLGEHGIQLNLKFLMTPEITSFAQKLAGQDIVCNGYTPILKMPTAGPRRFESPEGSHIDGMRQGITLYPANRYLVILLYLTDTEDYGGPLCLHPGSHRQVFEYGFKTKRDLSENWTKNGKTQAVTLPYQDKIPVPGKAGDTIFMHYLMVHSGSQNRSNHVRIALNGTAREISDRPYAAKSGAPASDWTPIDRTLRTDTISPE